MNNQPQRKPTRLKDYDYSTPGAYFVTVCTHNRKNLFGNILSGDIFSAPQIILSSIGKIATQEVFKFIATPSFTALLIFAKEIIDSPHAWMCFSESRKKPYLI